MRNEDCIYYGGIDEDGMHVCENSCSIYSEDENMCHNCRLWDAYTPKKSTKEEIEKAKKWQNMSYEEQLENPYEKYFQ